MGIGVSVFLLAVGAVLAFAVRDAVDGVALGTVGWILMGAGLLGLLLSLAQGRRTTTRATVVEERRVRDDLV